MLASPATGATVSRTTNFVWTSFSGGVHELDCVSGAMPTSAAPDVSLYTADTSATWPDLSVAQIAFPSGRSYACTVVGLGAFASLDAAVGPTGLAAAAIPDSRRSYGPATLVTMTP